jgi:hypothetical protein
MWIPKSQIKGRKKDASGKLCKIEIPMWLARERGLIDDKDSR